MRTGATLAAAVAFAAALAPAVADADTFTVSGNTGGEFTYAVPAGVSGVHVVLVGGRGAGFPFSTTLLGGFGAKLTADVPLPPGTTQLFVEVAGDGGGASASPWASGGYDGGGGGAFGGGGATDIRTISCGSACASGGVFAQPAASLGSRLAVAGGGGGTGVPTAGGSAGNTNGSGSGGSTVLSGGGATTASGGSVSSASDVDMICSAMGDQAGQPGLPGALGDGGGAITFLVSGQPLSGGGGGGLYGGGGGAQCFDSSVVATDHSGSGGGGSSGAPGASNLSISTDTADQPEAMITAPVPAATAPPTVSGAALVGSTLTESHAAWSASGPINVQWQRCNNSGAACTAIGGATGQAYTLTKADIGHTLRAQETATNFYGTGAPSTSSATGVVGEPPTITSPPTISGTVKQGEVLDEAHGAWTDGPVTTYAYQWLRCNPSGAACSPIVGAVNQAYTLATADVGSTIRVQETAANSYGTSAPATSNATAAVQATVPPVQTTVPPPHATVPPTVAISGPGQATVGKAVRFTAAASDSEGTPTSFVWSVGGKAVGTGATLTYTFRSKGSRAVAVAVTDNAGNAFTASLPVQVSARRLGTIAATMTWAFRTSRDAVSIGGLAVHRAPIGARVVVQCAGHGCPHARTLAVRVPRCKPTKKHRCGRPPTVENVSLTRIFAHRSLARAARVTVRIVRPEYVGKVYVFSMKRPGSPVVACLAPGEKVPGRGC